VTVLTAWLIAYSFGATGQGSGEFTSPYSVNLKVEIPAIAVGAAGGLYGLSRLDALTSISEEQVLSLNSTDVNSFDRWVFDYPLSGYESARTLSDLGLNGTVVLPAFLLLNKNIRKDWLTVGLLYAESHLVSALLYQGAVFSIKRARPLVYNQDLELYERAGGNKNNSFLSGHTSTTATASFFAAKVWCDYNQPDVGGKIIAYSLAFLPPAGVGYFRMKAGKHFLSDVLSGLLMGASVGILTPHLHKVKSKGLTVIPAASSEFLGLSLRLSVR
jgi:membrane-associated phospholipid phosphatase